MRSARRHSRRGERPATERLPQPDPSQAEKYGKEIVIADREMVESKADEILAPAKDGNVAFLVVGDVLA